MPFQRLLPLNADTQASGQHDREETGWWLRPAGDGGGWLRYRQCQLPRLCTVLTIQAMSLVSPLFIYRMQPSIRKRLATLADLFPREWFSWHARSSASLGARVIKGAVTSNWRVTASDLYSRRYSFAALRTAVILCSSPGARLMDEARILLASTQRNCVHSPSPKSPNRTAPSRHGFHKTVVSELVFFNRIRRCNSGSNKVTSFWVPIKALS